jgi:peptide deformylase
MTKILPIHYKISKPVARYSEIKKEAEELKRFIVHGDFKGLYNKAFALAHSQVSETPMSFFVVAPDCVWPIKGAERMFESQVIINPKIIKSPNYRQIVREGKEPLMVPNGKEYYEPSMSFPFRKAKRIVRYDLIEVEYQIKGFFGLKTIKRELSGVASEIYQCMFDHAQGKNIYFDNETPVKWWELIGTKKSKSGCSLDVEFADGEKAKIKIPDAQYTTKNIQNGEIKN